MLAPLASTRRVNETTTRVHDYHSVTIENSCTLLAELVVSYRQFIGEEINSKRLEVYLQFFGDYFESPIYWRCLFYDLEVLPFSLSHWRFFANHFGGKPVFSGFLPPNTLAIFRQSHWRETGFFRFLPPTYWRFSSN